jgi:thiamine-monophosphate kinase
MLSERHLISHIQRLAEASPIKMIVRGIGDDCAVLRPAPGTELLVTTDLCVENVHFRRSWHPAASVGHRCLTRGLSDIAAMGGEPLACFLSLGLPKMGLPKTGLPKTGVSQAGVTQKWVTQEWITQFLQGLLALARRHKVQLAGGDISSAPKITADIVVVGQAPKGKAILRSGARPGDRIYVTGSLGGSAGILKQLYAGKPVKPTKSSPHFYPVPRLNVGTCLRKRATAMIDLSDGLSVDLAHICQESHVSALIFADQIPIAKTADLELALHGGEDYELLFTARKQTRIPSQIAGVRITEIGEIGVGAKNPADYSSAIQILGQNGLVRPLAQRGWEHFRKKR